MGIPGLETFVREKRIPVPFRLHDTVLVIDGLNLEIELYEASLKNQNNKAYGGDYAHFSAYIEKFFKDLQSCAIKPVIIMDGSFKADKLSKLNARYTERLLRAQKIYKTLVDSGSQVGSTKNCAINSLFNSSIFVRVAKRLGIHVYKSIFEADDILPRIAADLGAPLVSGDSDFFLDHLPAGLINPSSLLSPDLKVNTDLESGQKFITCQIYKLGFLERKFPGLTPELAPIGGAILGNDYLPVDTGIIKKLVALPNGSRPLNRKQRIDTVFRWLSGQPSVPVVLATLQKLSDNHSHPLIRYIKNVFQNPSQRYSTTVSRSFLSIEKYFTANRSTLFAREATVPQWIHDRYVDERLNYRALTIFLRQIDFLCPLIEDYSLEKSSYHAVFELCNSIYGLLRSDDMNPKPVRRFVRSGEQRVKEIVVPAIQIANKRLPLLSQIAPLSQMERITLFYEIIDLPPSLYAEMTALFPLDRPIIGIELSTLLLSLIYLCRHYPEDIWLEFFYALYVSILLMGHYSANLVTRKLLELNQKEHVKLVKKLNGFNSIPAESMPYLAPIVHQYNAFQCCLDNITFLAQILDLGKVFNADHLVSGLQGTFIYNITIHLATQRKPLSCLKNLLGGPNFKYFGLFEQLLNVLLERSGRKLIGTGLSLTAAGGVIPVAFASSSSGNCHFVRGLKKKKKKKKKKKIRKKKVQSTLIVNAVIESP